LRGEIRQIQQSLGITTIMVTHDQEEAMTMADRIIVMNEAVVEQIGTPRDIYDHPAAPFVAAFIGTMNFINNHGQVCAIRPEYVEVADHNSGFDTAARVRAVEFRGALTRVHGVLNSDVSEVCLDLPSKRADELQLLEGSTIYLRMPREHLVTYPVAA